MAATDLLTSATGSYVITTLLLRASLAPQSLFFWGHWAVLRIDGQTSHGVSVIEVASVVSIFICSGLIVA